MCKYSICARTVFDDVSQERDVAGTVPEQGKELYNAADQSQNETFEDYCDN
jgi:hypothetical protein